jgi:hypothetical protein
MDAEHNVPSLVLVILVNVAGIVGFVVEPSRNAKQTATSPLANVGSVAEVVPAATPT